jgi:tRNA G18 (ribose-2'-O)-methylase SpoU
VIHVLYDRLNNGVFEHVSSRWQCSPPAHTRKKGHIVPVIHLESLDGEELRDYRDLTDVVLRRLQEPAGGLYIAESSKVIGRALHAGHHPRSVLTLEKWLPEILDVLSSELAEDEVADLPIYIGESELLESLTGFNLHRGALASMHRPALKPVEEIVAGATRIIVLEDIVDHTNVGAIFRSVAGLGADAVLITPRCADPLYRRSVRVSMGTVLQIPWTRLPEWPDGADILKSLGFSLAALALSDDAVELDDYAANPPAKVALILGTEGDGLSRAALAAADTVVTIPMLHGVDSLNVASASAVALYALRQR